MKIIYIFYKLTNLDEMYSSRQILNQADVPACHEKSFTRDHAAKNLAVSEIVSMIGKR
jgi:hypothetical protein